MFKNKIVLLLIIVVLLSGCSTEIEMYPQPSQDEDLLQADDERSKETLYSYDPDYIDEENEWVMLPIGETSDSASQTPVENVLLNREQAVRLFLEAWDNNDLEKMNMLTAKPLEQFFRESDMGFVSYASLDKGDLLMFVRECMANLKQYGMGAVDDAAIESPAADSDNLKVDMGENVRLNITLALDRNMWKLERISADIFGLEGITPQVPDTLGQLILTDVKDMNGDGDYELLTMGFRGEWEGIGPEPTSAIGLYTCTGKQISNIYFRDMNDKLERNRVVIEGGMGRVMEGRPVLLVLIEKTAQDNLSLIEGPASQYYVSLYRLAGEELIKVGEIDWQGAVADVLDSSLIPEWVELLAIKKFKRGATENIALRVGLRDRRDGDASYQTNEGLFILSYEEDKWSTVWHHEGTYGEYHTVVFEDAGPDGHPIRMYYMEDAPYHNGVGGGVYEVCYRNGRWTDSRIFSEKLNIKAAGDITGDDNVEFLTFDGSTLKILTKDGRIIGDVNTPRDTKEVPHAWIGNVKGKQRIIAALHMGDYINMRSRVYVWEEQDGLMKVVWQSEDLGSDGITAMVVKDLDMDGVPELLVNYTDDYLIWGQYFKIFEP